MLELWGLLLCFVPLVFGIGPALMPASLGSPLQRTVVGVAASLVVIYLVSFGIYVLNLPVATHRYLLLLPLLITVLCRRRLGGLWADPLVRQAALAWLAVATWLAGWQFTVFSYSGSTWEADWYEHYDRARFFIQHWDVNTRFLGVYSLASRPPLANIVNGAFLSLAGTKFHLFQAASVLLASLVTWPVRLLQQRLVRPDAPVRIGWAVLLLMSLPALAQNAAFTWTKLPTTFFVLTGLALLTVPAPTFSGRLAGWLSLTAGMLAHYSAGPWIVAIAAAELARGRSGWRWTLGWQGVAVALACSAFFTTWLGWSVLRLGIRDTVGSNSTVVSSTGLTVGTRLGQAATNLYYTGVPAILRPVDHGFHRADDALGRLRDGYFNLVQPNLPMLAGLCGIPVAAWLARRDRKLARPEAVRYWTVLLALAFILGVAVVSEVVVLGVAQICLLPIALLVVAWLAARAPGAAPGVRAVLLFGAACDVVLGIILHFAIQSHWLPHWLHPNRGDMEIARLFGHAAPMNLTAKLRIGEPFLHDLPSAVTATVLLLAGALCLLAASLHLPSPGPAALGRPGRPA